MSQDELITAIKGLKNEFLEDGFVIDGVFGSYARGAYTKKSDIDLLYHLEEPFFKKYSGFIGFKKLDEIKQKLSNKLGKEIDLAPKDNLSNTARKYILSEVIYV